MRNKIHNIMTGMTIVIIIIISIIISMMDSGVINKEIIIIRFCNKAESNLNIFFYLIIIYLYILN